jgi:hypothetical protein|tara:strand:+ start:534 stop:1043 length:510 start_codon:yes stop_codon:yes gene_type:complete
MQFNKLSLAIILFITFHHSISKAEGFDFSLGTGYPYLLVPEVSIKPEKSEIRWFANFKLGFGGPAISLGIEKPISENKKHSVGFLIGGIGQSDDKTPCKQIYEGQCLLAGGFSFDFDLENTNGVAAMYTYNSDGLNNSGWRYSIILGYGEGEDSGDSKTDGSVNISYQF